MLPEAEAFEIAVSKTIAIEGKPGEVKGDKGGMTKYGISRAFMQRVSGSPVSNSFITSLTLSDAKEIYRKFFWYGPKIHRIPDDKLREIVFDQAVNRGEGSAIRMLQLAIIRVSNKPLAVDGVLGPKTIAAIAEASAETICMAFMRECQLAYVGIVKEDQSQIKFLAGWINRTWSYL